MAVAERKREVSEISAWPTQQAFADVCKKGLSAVRPLLPSAREADPWGWNFGSAVPPSYWAYGRLRALLTLNVAAALQPRSVLEAAAGDAALSACLQIQCSEVTVNDLRGDLLRSCILN